MITFKSLTLQNFLSYGAIPTTVQLDRPGTTLILGEDLDHTSSSGSGGNGVGKTSILNALVYAVYDQPISKINIDNLVNNINKKNMMVTVIFEKDGHNYTIIRNRKTKAGATGNFTTLLKDGIDITPAGADNTNAEIIKIIGIPYEIFVRVVAFSAIHTPFLDLPTRSGTGANQTDIIEELFDLKTLSEKADILKRHIKETETSLKMQQEKASMIDREQERHTKQLEAATRRVDMWRETNISNIEELRHQIVELHHIDVDQQKKIIEQVDELEKCIELANKDRQHWDTIHSDTCKVIKEKKHELQHLDGGKCPYCKQGFEISQAKRGTIDDKLIQAQTQLNDASEKIKTADLTIKKLLATYKSAKVSLKVDGIEDLLQIDSNIKQLSTKLVDMQVAINPYNETLDELKTIKFEEKDTAAINTLKSMLDHQTFLLKVLTKKDSFVRKALLNKNIPFLNKRLQTYLIDLGLPHNVEFTHEMSASISQFGHAMDFGNLSNGQRARVNLALSFAFRDVLQSMHDHVNICLLDEVLDVGLDTVGVHAAAKLLKRKSREEKLALYIISHRDEIDSAFDRKLIVQMSSGFSSLRYEDS